MIYAWRYPKSIHRSVMVAVNPPGHFVWDAKTTDEQIRRYAALCAEDASCRRRTPDLAASLHSAFENIPERWWFLPVREGNVQSGRVLRPDGIDHGRRGTACRAVDDRHAPFRRRR